MHLLLLNKVIRKKDHDRDKRSLAVQESSEGRTRKGTNLGKEEHTNDSGCGCLRYKAC